MASRSTCSTSSCTSRGSSPSPDSGSSSRSPEEEIRGPIPDGVRYRYPRDWWRLDRRLLEVVETRRIDTPADLLGLLPGGLPEPFTTADIVAATGRSKRLAMRAVYCLERSGGIARLARRGRLAEYSLVAPASVAEA